MSSHSRENRIYSTVPCPLVGCGAPIGRACRLLAGGRPFVHPERRAQWVAAVAAEKPVEARAWSVDVTQRCKHCGDSRKNHTPSGAKCKSPSMRQLGRRFTPWTQAEYDAAVAEAKARHATPEPIVEPTVEFRRLFPFRPWGLAILKADNNRVLEITSYPWRVPSADASTRVHIMARTTIGDATTNTELNVDDIAPWPEALMGDETTYRNGFMRGWAAAVAEAQRLRLETKPEGGR